MNEHTPWFLLLAWQTEQSTSTHNGKAIMWNLIESRRFELRILGLTDI